MYSEVWEPVLIMRISTVPSSYERDVITEYLIPGEAAGHSLGFGIGQVNRYHQKSQPALGYHK